MWWYLDKVRDVGLSAVRFVDGEYGSGKTHFLRMTAYEALERKFVVSEVTLRPEVRLDRFNTVWREIMQTIATPESDGMPEGIASMLNRWCSEVENDSTRLEEMLHDLDGANNLDPDFRIAVRGYLQAFATGGDLDVYLQWLKGDAVRPPHVRVTISRENARAMLRSFVCFLCIIGYSGLVIFLDELELILTQNFRTRNASYDTLRQFIDNADNTDKFLLICSATPQMYQDHQRGFPSYPALWQRTGGMLANSRGDYRAIRINLSSPDADLTSDNLFQIARQIRDIHAVAEDWNASEIVSEEHIQQIVNGCISQGTEAPLPRLISQTMVNLLERLQQNPHSQVGFEKTITETVKEISQQDQTRYTPWR